MEQGDVLLQKTQGKVGLGLRFYEVGEVVLKTEVSLMTPAILCFKPPLFEITHPSDLGECFPVGLTGKVQGTCESMDQLVCLLRDFFHTEWFARAVGRLSSAAGGVPGQSPPPILVSCG